MATITVKNIPDAVYERLKAAAAANRRSINSEILVCIERSVAAQPVAPEHVVARARRLRALTAGSALTAEEFRAIRDAGRP
jgi:plasmid stability protein